jgi:hypothetical protein
MLIMNPIVFLTATITVKDHVGNTVRRDPAVRRRDYENALRCWLETPGNFQIVFCENSGSDLSSLQTLCEQHNPYRRQVEFLSFDAPAYAPHKGKGYGEMLILEHALKHSRLIQPQSPLIKVTGRHYMKNFSALLQAVEQHSETEIFCIFYQGLTYVDTRCFVMRACLAEKYLLPLAEQINEEQHLWFEHVTAQAVHRAIADQHCWRLPPEAFEIVGTSATHGGAELLALPQRVKAALQMRLKHRAFDL